MRGWLRLMLLLLPLALAAGCTTDALWNKTNLDAWNEPATDPNLRLFHAEPQKDLLVAYEEYSERSGATQTRAYLLYQNQKRLEQRRRPRFVSTNRLRALPPVPVFQTPPAPGTNFSQTLYAVVSTNGPSFTIYSGDRVVSAHELPSYNDGKGRAARIALTPLAVTADITIIGGFVFLMAWAEGGWFWLH